MYTNRFLLLAISLIYGRVDFPRVGEREREKAADGALPLRKPSDSVAVARAPRHSDNILIGACARFTPKLQRAVIKGRAPSHPGFCETTDARNREPRPYESRRGVRR